MSENIAIIETFANEYLTNLLDWSINTFDLPILRLDVFYNFSKRKSDSYCKGSLLKFDIFLALQDILDVADRGTTAIFYEQGSWQNDPYIGNFIGTWQQHVKALICHELAHLFETTANQEPLTTTSICKRYGLPPKCNKFSIHHNLLWKTIYADLKVQTPKSRTLESLSLIKKPRMLSVYYLKECKSENIF